MTSVAFVGLQLLVLQPQVNRSEEEAPRLEALVTDPFILVRKCPSLVRPDTYERSRIFMTVLRVSG